MICKMKVTLRCQTLQCQCHLHVYAMENQSSSSCWQFDGFLGHFKSFFVWSGWWYRWLCWCWVRKKWLYALLKVEQEEPYNKADLSKEIWNGMLSCSRHSHFGIWTFEEVGGGGGGRGRGGEKGAGSESVYYEHWHVTCLASGVRICVHCFACWSTPEAISFSQSLHLILDPGKTGICWSSRGSELSSW